MLFPNYENEIIYKIWRGFLKKENIWAQNSSKFSELIHLIFF